MAVLVVITAATVGVLISSLDAIRGNSDRVEAASLARTRLAELRVLGADLVAPNDGENVDTRPDYQGTGFDVTTTARWVGFTEDTNPCASVVGGSPQQGYVQARISVIGGELQAPQYVDALIPPLEGVPEVDGGAATVFVRDQAGAPLSGWQVTATSTASGATPQAGASGTDGCLHFASLVPGAWTFDLLVGSDWMTEPGTTSSRQVTIGVGDNAAMDTFVVARPVAGIRLTAGSGPEYPLLDQVPLSVNLGSLGTVQRFMPREALTLPAAGERLWPDPLGYSASLGCVDAGGPTAIAVQPAVESAVTLPTAIVDIVGPDGNEVTVRHAADPGGTGVCAGTPAAIGTLTVPVDPEQPDAETGPSGRVGISLPRGRWTLSTSGEDDITVVIGEAVSCSVHWPAPVEPPSLTWPPPPPTPTEQPLFALCPTP